MSTQVGLEGLTDEQLMAKFKATQEAGYFETIFSRHKKRITDYLTKEHTRGDRHLAEDLTQEVFIKAFERHAQVAGSICGWLIMIATRCATDHHRRRTRDKRGGQGGEVSLNRLAKRGAEDDDGSSYDGSIDYLHPADDAASPDLAALQGDERQRLRDTLLTLTQDKRHLLDAVYFQGMTLEQYSTDFNVAYGTVCSRLHRTLGELRLRLDPGTKAMEAA